MQIMFRKRRQSIIQIYEDSVDGTLIIKFISESNLQLKLLIKTIKQQSDNILRIN